MLSFYILGTRIIYDRAFLMQCRNSPLAKSPPNLPNIPGVTSPSTEIKENGHEGDKIVGWYILCKVQGGMFHNHN